MNAIRRRALQDAANDVCMYCSRRAADAGAVKRGPAGSGNWVHEVYGSNVLCPATSIFNRLESEAGPSPSLLECVMCGNYTFQIDPNNPSNGYCEAEHSFWSIRGSVPMPHICENEVTRLTAELETANRQLKRLDCGQMEGNKAGA